ncbi:GTP-binding protein Era [Geobacter sulfurreducens PCA]|jgi:GTP-binding protein Era|uniref:GTPase Era n=1 Tax=Geobacter sulfurreducens (strain ATCC 51573 / DSM 12127 / PCA) TaxID=243231 RepID=Q74AX3_GEOSL|nr:GTP-binding protein Era [Geobacter sulfurreducens PCA]ADI84984.1 GTP-binding protein Era [Geobacter sulfurreducens KN400]AJY68464.1 GTPase Era [Geobacter sulfurreducens]HBB69475.1 GTPase Era [Geobacter sulfurreducens]HCD94989.1 GTPase Era [Geobacter sulfurreducens]
MLSKTPFRSGFVSIIGRPNVGKSTLLNRILGEKIVITSDKPQTTRNRIQGIHNLPGAQIVFIDTPGIHHARSRLNKFMVEEALSSIREVDLVMLLVEANRAPGDQEREIAGLLPSVNVPVFLVVNKIDLIDPDILAERLTAYAELFPFREVVPVSAETGENVERLVEVVRDTLPEGPVYFPDDILTDLPERFIVAEIVREKVFRLTRDEIPYSTAVEVDSFREREDGGLVSISATITVERDSQKGIIIGRKGAMLKQIGSEARLEIERLLDTKVFLELFVRVRRDWSENPNILKELGYR